MATHLKRYDERPKSEGSEACRAWDFFEKEYPQNGIISLQHCPNGTGWIMEPGWAAEMTSTCAWIGRTVIKRVSTRRLP